MKTIEKTRILKTDINWVNTEDLISFLKNSFNGKNRNKIAKVNAEFLLRAQSDKEFASTLNDFSLAIADGTGVLWAAKYFSIPLSKIPGLRHLQAWWQAVYSLILMVIYPKYCHNPIPERFPGVEALYLMLKTAETEGVGVYCFGAEKEVLEKAIEEIKKRFPRIVLAGYHDGYDYTDNEVVKDINLTEAKLLIVALGSPKQEYWIRDNLDKLTSVRVAVGEGGSFDFVSGVHKRAPEWMRAIGLEWFWRMFMNKDKTGKSRVKRIYRAVPLFIVTVIKEKINEK